MNDLTVIICAYNAEKFIERTLYGFLKQTLRSFRLLVVDDCSTDNTAKIVKSFIHDHNLNDWNIVTLQKNVGLAASRKYGEQLVSTEFILDFDADDIALPEMLEKEISILRGDINCMGVGSYCSYIDEQDNEINAGFYIGPLTKTQFIHQAKKNKLIFLHHPMYRRKIASQVGGRSVEGFPIGSIRYQDMCEDLDLWMRMTDLYIYDKYFIVIPKSLFLYRKHSKAMSSSAYPMNQRIRHIKNNMLRRRSGAKELSFIEYEKSLTNFEKFKNYWQDLTSECYKLAGANFLSKNYFNFFLYISLTIFLSPTFAFHKIKINILRKKVKNDE